MSVELDRAWAEVRYASIDMNKAQKDLDAAKAAHAKARATLLSIIHKEQGEQDASVLGAL